MITIQVLNAVDGDATIAGTAPRKLSIARGLLPSGQLFMESKVHEGHEPEVQNAAVRELTTWLQDNRPDWRVEMQEIHR
jgi:hypothetical protein